MTTATTALIRGSRAPEPPSCAIVSRYATILRIWYSMSEVSSDRCDDGVVDDDGIVDADLLAILQALPVAHDDILIPADVEHAARFVDPRLEHGVVRSHAKGVAVGADPQARDDVPQRPRRIGDELRIRVHAIV